MVAEFEHDDPDHVVISQEERSTFYRYRSVPPGCRIWIASTDVQAWREQLFRFTGHLVTKPIPNSRPAKQNVQTITFGMGHLIIQIICAETERLIEKIGPWYEPDLIKPVWPVPREGIRWPPARNLSAREIAYVGTILSDLKGAPSPKS